ncbi:MAG: arsenite methyltransferase [Dehalococcoidia bacterium]|nr:arsenite methyltransferase [Dehalococcoidia bacterium]
MTTEHADDVRSAVRERYGARAREVAAGSAGEGASGYASTLYAGEAEALPEGVVSYGCGNPVAIAGLQAGETVLDLGSGAGLDCFLAAKQVGPSGRVIGLDMTDEMLALAETNREKVGVANVEFRKGVIEQIPLDDASVDVIISNCVINLSPDKDAVFDEAARVLRPGGRFQVSDIVLRRPVSEAEQADMELWSACKSGALVIDDYTARLRAAGFEDVEVLVPDSTGAEDEPAWVSALVNARRPGGAGTGQPWVLPGGRHIELLAPIGLESGACRGDSTSACC